MKINEKEAKNGPFIKSCLTEKEKKIFSKKEKRALFRSNESKKNATGKLLCWEYVRLLKVKATYEKAGVIETSISKLACFI